MNKFQKINSFTFIIALGLIGLAQAQTDSVAVSEDREIYDWQANRYPNTQESFKEDVDKQLRPRPELSTGEEMYNWQLDDYDNTEESFKEDIEKQLRPKPEFTTGEEVYRWQLEEYPNTTEEMEPTLPERY